MNIIISTTNNDDNNDINKQKAAGGARRARRRALAADPIQRQSEKGRSAPTIVFSPTKCICAVAA